MSTKGYNYFTSQNHPQVGYLDELMFLALSMQTSVTAETQSGVNNAAVERLDTCLTVTMFKGFFLIDLWYYMNGGNELH